MRLTLFFILTNLCIFHYANAQEKLELKFEHINATLGLSHSSVISILQDYDGYMWFGTINGLNRYDGYEIKVYKNIPKDTTSLTDSEILYLFEDSNNNLWVCTGRGICLYDRDKDQFIRMEEPNNIAVSYMLEDGNHDLWIIVERSIYKYNSELQIFEAETPLLFDEELTIIYEDGNDTFWISNDAGVYTYNRQEKRLNTKLPIKGVRSFTEDSQGNLWFASYSHGIYLYDTSNDTYKLFTHLKNDPNSLPSTQVLTLEVDHLDRIWVGTQNSGLSIFDYKKNKFYNYLSDEGNPESLSFNTINDIYRDNSNNMWLGTFSGGVDLVRERKFAHFKNNALNKFSLSNNNILSFFEDSRGNIWIGTDGGGLNLFDKTSGEFKRFQHDPANTNSISTNIITSIVEDKDGNLWFGYYSGGLDRYDPRSNKFTHYKHEEENPESSLIDNNVMYLYIDKKDNLWVGTPIGLNLMNKKTGEFISYRMDVPGLGNYPGSMLEDKDGNLWYGSWDGLFLLNAATKETEYFGYNEKDSTTLSNNRIYVIHEDGKGRLWLGTGSGLNLFDKERKTFTAYYESDGLPSNVIYGILEDDDGNLWLSTGNGLSRFDPSTKSTKNFNVHDGLQGNEFKIHAYLRLRSGEFLFGGANGFNMFHPDKIKENPYIPPLVITGFKIFNSPVKPGTKNSPLQKRGSQTKEIILSYKHSVFSFDFAALNYLSPQKNQYAYKMEGFETGWNYVGNTRSATYTNLDPGKYTFRVKGSNNDGLWNEEGTSIAVIITPPYWQTWWFRILAAILVATIAVTWYRMRVRSIKQQNEDLENQVRQRTAEISQQKNELKKQGDVLEKLYTEVKDSIRAAEVIQQSIFPSEECIHEFLPESFLLNKPKDVVSGDFHWFEKVEGKIIIAAVDCTGHGVSGAFMSIIGHNQLSQAIHMEKNFTAADILNRLNAGIIKKMHSQNNNSLTRAGMDIALCVIDENKKQMQFAGANNPLYILRKNRIMKVEADKYPIGMTIKGKKTTYSNKVIDLKSGDIYYIFSDGYADQIGGPDHEKFMYDRLRALLVQAGHEPMYKQKEILNTAFINWQGEAEQLDDVLVIGFKV